MSSKVAVFTLEDGLASVVAPLMMFSEVYASIKMLKHKT